VPRVQRAVLQLPLEEKQFHRVSHVGDFGPRLDSANVRLSRGTFRALSSLRMSHETCGGIQAKCQMKVTVRYTEKGVKFEGILSVSL